MTNKIRAKRCERALRNYNTDDALRTCLIDLLSDARHWCDANGLNYADLDRIGYEHYSAEVVDERRRKS